MPVYCEHDTEQSIRRIFSYAFRPGTEKWPAGFLPKLDFVPIEPGVAVRRPGQTVMPIRLIHGPFPVLGFRVGYARLLYRRERSPRRQQAASRGTGRADPGRPAL